MPAPSGSALKNQGPGSISGSATARPQGRAGRAVAEFFGGDPRTRLNQDLGRLKTLLETTVRSDSHGQEPGT